MSERRAGGLRADLGANAASQFAAAAIPLFGVPILLRAFSLGTYGFIGLFSALAVTFTVLTRGLGWSLQREVAGSWPDTHGREDLARSFRTYETLSWATGALLALLLVLLARPLASAFETSGLDETTLRLGFFLLACRVWALLPYSTYQATLFGSGSQVRANVLMASGLIATAVVALGLALATESLIVYLLADTAGWLATTAALGIAARAALPRRNRARRWLNRAEIRQRSGLAGGLVWTHGSGLFLGQADRLSVGALLPLGALGAYTPASTAARALSLTYSPLLAATYPRLCRLAAAGQDVALRAALRRTTALTTWSSGCAAAILVFFGHDVLALWTGRPDLADRAAPALAVCAIAGVFLGQVDALLQLHSALGSSRVAVKANSIALVWCPPLILVLVHFAGITGAAFGWLAYTAVSWVVFLIATERRLPTTAKSQLRALLPPLAAIAAAVALARLTVEALTLAGWPRLLTGTGVAVLLVALTCVVMLGGPRRAGALIAEDGSGEPAR